ncbi:prephenate dehydratase domain-containing protein [Sphingomonas sp. LHG3406-1]|uniref:prephenate dehydratase domain-containing protein n=1 Tax=Sphingomonas sp. LHG3406-1 TaxID=2804617 RepID=UPI0026112844|nr:prephenate dehydratase domain-containing protein [Sphingomonas sp. LHG3406-1]
MKLDPQLNSIIASPPVDLLRADIDRIDDQILALLEQRYPLVQRIAAAKNIEQEPALALRPARERHIVDRLSARAVQVPAEDVRHIWRSILSLSAKHQRAYRIILWGPETARLALSTLAAARYGDRVAIDWAGGEGWTEALEEARRGDAILMVPADMERGAAWEGLDLIARHPTGCDTHPWVMELGRLADSGEWLGAEGAAEADAAPRRTVAYLGGHGSFSEEACLRFVPAHDLLACGDFETVLRAVREGTADLAVVPVENSLAGPITAVRDLLGHAELKVIGEERLDVRLHLLGTEGAAIRGIERVASHAAALTQCAEWLGGHSWERTAVASTSEAAAMVAAAGDPQWAAIGSEVAAALHGLTILARDLQGSAENVTRFAIVERRDSYA